MKKLSSVIVLMGWVIAFNACSFDAWAGSNRNDKGYAVIKDKDYKMMQYGSDTSDGGGGRSAISSTSNSPKGRVDAAYRSPASSGYPVYPGAVVHSGAR